MNPYRLKNVFEYLTSNNQLLKKKLKLGTDEIPIPPKRKDVIDIEAINRFNKANPRVDTTNLKPLSVKHSNVRQSNVMNLTKVQFNLHSIQQQETHSSKATLHQVTISLNQDT